MEQNIEILDAGGIVCDNPSCDWNDKTVSVEDTEKFLNKPCPKCGDNLLTQEDFDNFVAVIEAIKKVNAISKEELIKLSDENDGPVRVMVTTHKQVSFDIHELPK